MKCHLPRVESGMKWGVSFYPLIAQPMIPRMAEIIPPTTLIRIAIIPNKIPVAAL
jgi:hypothetical protein